MNLRAVVGITATAAFIAGSAAGYFAAKQYLTSRFDEELESQIAEAKRYYATLYKRGDFQTPEKAAEKLLPAEAMKALREYNGKDEKQIDRLYKGVQAPEDEKKPGHVNYRTVSKKTVEVVEETVARKNVFEDPDAEVDVAMEIRNRTEEAPYIISLEEYNEDEEFAKSSITYYGGDGVLADERDESIRDIDMVVGEYNIVRFGHRSGDKNLLYVRNHILGTDYEIQYSNGKYTKEVLDLD